MSVEGFHRMLYRQIAAELQQNKCLCYRMVELIDLKAPIILGAIIEMAAYINCKFLRTNTRRYLTAVQLFKGHLFCFPTHRCHLGQPRHRERAKERERRAVP